MNVREGRWRTVRAHPLAILATTAAALDVVTTTAILSSPRFAELNGLLSLLSGVHLGLAVGYFTLLCGLLSLATWLRLGWLSTLCGTYLVVAMGVGGGVNNLVLFSTGASLYDRLPVDPTVAYTSLLAVSVVVALALISRHDRVPWRELGVGVLLFTAGELLTVGLRFL